MKKIKLAILTTIILLTGCSKYTIIDIDKHAAEPVTSESAQTEIENDTLSSAKKFIQLTMVSTESGFALTEDNRVYKTSDGGLNWSEFYTIQTSDNMIMAYPVIYSVDDHTLYITAYYDNQINFISTSDDGNTWSSTAVNSELSWVKNDISGYNMDFLDTDKGYLLINSTPGAGQMLKVLYKTTDAGVNWDMVVGDQGGEDNIEGITSSGVNGFPNGISFINPEDGWIVCGSNGAPPYGAYFYKTNNGGNTWDNAEIPELPKEFSEWDPSEFYIGASTPSFYGNENKRGKMVLSFHLYGETDKDVAYIYSYSDNETWRLEGKCNDIINNVNFMDDNNGIGLDTEGNLCKTADGGLTWNRQVINLGAAAPSPTSSTALTSTPTLIPTLNIPDTSVSDTTNEPENNIGQTILMEKNSIYHLNAVKLKVDYQSNDTIRVRQSPDDWVTGESVYIIGCPETPINYYMGFATNEFGWLIVNGSVSTSLQYHYVYLTEDGGKTWSETENTNERRPQMLSGAGFSEEKIGFLNYIYKDGPAGIVDINQSLDGGKTWAQLQLNLPEKYMDCTAEALDPIFDGANGVMPIQLTSGNLETINCYTADYGRTWSFNKQ